jgi:hypothetical protein
MNAGQIYASGIRCFAASRMQTSQPMRADRALLLAGVILYASHALAAPKMLTSQCTEVDQPDGRHVRTCLGPGEAPWSAQRPHRAPLPVQPVAPPAPEVAAIPPPPPPAAPSVAPVGVAPIPQYQTPPRPDNRIRQRFLFRFGPFRFVTPPIVVGRYN